ncbi:MAG: DEAD/DEAH box helicase family protein [Campylobacterales bacterium]|nr:DEAD/DEAH box helicase family protein [Campylobacterales bacterium]
MQLNELYSKLNSLESQKQSIEKEILQTKQIIEKLSPFSKQQKISLFKSLFIAREDVFPTYWISKDGTKKGYSPVAYTFRGNDYVPIDDNIIQKHLEGKIRLGTYAVINQTMAKFLVIDLDKASFIEDTRAINQICKEFNILPLIELSKSGNGIHIWFFFDGLVLASSVRKLGDILITKAMDIGNGIDMSSYDRMFPNQDFVATDALGNLVALPLQYTSRIENKTVFIDIDTMQPFPDQWSILKNVSKISSSKLLNILQNTIVSNTGEVDSLMPWEIKQSKPISFPKTTKAIIYEALYIEKMELSKTLLNTLQRLASFTNPEFYIRQNLRKSTFNTPRVISLFDLNERYVILPRGLITKVQDLFTSNNATLTIEDERFTKNIDKPKFIIKLRDEQKIAFDKILKNNYSILIAPPGFGKTAIASAVIAKRGVNTLILVHKITLLEQWADRLSEYFEIDKKIIGQLGKGKKKLTSNIDIAMLQSLKNKPELIEDYSQIIIDEAHHIPAVSFEVPLKKFKGKFVVALSATPKRQDGMHPIMSMQCGEIVHEVKRNKEQTNILKSIRTNFEAYKNEFTMILGELIEDFDRNELIISEIEKLHGRKVLIISERIEHLNILYHGLKSKNIKSTLLYGGMGTKIQRVALAEAHEANIILSTSGYIGEGIDFAHLDTIVFTMPISYQGRIIQYLGRVGRRGQKCLAIDFVDENVAMLKSSFTKRLKGYTQMGYKHITSEKSALNLFD